MCSFPSWVSLFQSNFTEACCSLPAFPEEECHDKCMWKSDLHSISINKRMKWDTICHVHLSMNLILDFPIIADMINRQSLTRPHDWDNTAYYPISEVKSSNNILSTFCRELKGNRNVIQTVIIFFKIKLNLSTIVLAWRFGKLGCIFWLYMLKTLWQNMLDFPLKGPYELSSLHQMQEWHPFISVSPKMFENINIWLWGRSEYSKFIQRQIG